MPTNEPSTLQPLLSSITIMGSGRLGPTLTALIALIGTIIGGRALARAKRHARSDTDVGANRGRRSATAALVLGAISLVLGSLFLVAADGGPGTGNGVVASFAAIVLGPVAIVLGGLARAGRQEASSISSIQLESSTTGEPGSPGPKTP